MPYALTHILFAIILIELFRWYVIKDHKKFPRYYILVAAIGAVIPDLDIAIYYILYFFGFSFSEVHRTFLHSIFVPLFLLLIGIFINKYKIKNRKLGKHHINLSYVFYILSAMSLLHLILDTIFSGGVRFFYPFSSFIVGFYLLNFFPEKMRNLILPTIDVILIFIWIIILEFKIKVTSYI